MLQVFDRVLVSQSGETLLVLLLGVGVALALMLALDHLRGRLQGVAGDVRRASRCRRVVREDRRRAGRAAQRTRQPSKGCATSARCATLFSAQGLLALFDAPWVVVYVAVIWLAHPLLGMAAAAAAVLMLGLALINDRRHPPRHRGAAEGRCRRDALPRGLAAQRRGRADAGHGRCAASRAGSARTPRSPRCSEPTAAQDAWRWPRSRALMRQAVQVLMLALGAWLVITRQATPGVMVATTILLGRALAPVEQIVGSWRVLAEGRAAFGAPERACSTPPTPAARTHGLPAPVGALLAQDLVFRAPQQRALAPRRRVAAALQAGESLAIVGAERRRQVDAGALAHRRVDSRAPAACGSTRPTCRSGRAKSSGRMLGYVPQDVELFPGTVAENIARLGRGRLRRRSCRPRSARTCTR